MSRSYFSRISTPSPAKVLLPSRPIASLWKAARLERLAGISVNRRDIGLDFADSVEGRVVRPERLAERGGEGDSPAGLRQPEPSFSSEHRLEVEQNHIALPLSKTAAPKTEERETPRQRFSKTIREIEEATPIPARRDRDGAFTANSAPENRDLIPNAAAPTFARSAPALDAGPQTSAKTNSSLHIGKIEVQIVPTRSSSRLAPSPKPASRLARGYEL